MLVLSLSDLTPQTLDLVNKESELVEIRSDLIDINKYFNMILKITSPILLTLRPSFFKGEYSQILKKCFDFNPAYIDISYDLDYGICKEIQGNFPDAKIICSYHNYESTPGNLDQLLKNLQKKHPSADIYKMACMATSSLDAIRMLLFVKEKSLSSRSIIGHCMGEKGVISRILSPIFGSFFCYCSIDKTTASGQIDYLKQKNRYRYFNLNAETKIFALIGEDVKKSLSHITHNKIFALAKSNSIYIKISLQKKELNAFFNLVDPMKIKRFPISGMSITHPFKKEAKKYVRSKLHCINTATIKDRDWIGYNTDGTGAIEALLKNDIDLDSKKVVIIGASNTAFAIVKELKKYTSNIILINRSYNNLKTFEDMYKIKTYTFADLDQVFDSFNYDILINATSSIDPLAEKYFRKEKIAFDVNVRPFNTPFLIKAKNKSNMIIYGADLFTSQAKEQFKRFFI